MKIKVLKDTVAGGQAVKAGQVVDASDADARYLLAVGKAEEMTTEVCPMPEPVEAPKRKPRTKVTTYGNDSANA